MEGQPQEVPTNSAESRVEETPRTDYIRAPLVVNEARVEAVKGQELLGILGVLRRLMLEEQQIYKDKITAGAH